MQYSATRIDPMCILAINSVSQQLKNIYNVKYELNRGREESVGIGWLCVSEGIRGDEH